MRYPVARFAILFGAILLAPFGCTKDYAPYEGEAYPNHRPKINIPAGGLGYVTDSRSDTVSLLDLGTGEFIGSSPVGRDPVTIDGPHHVVADPVGRYVYVALSYPVIAGSVGPHASHGSSTRPGYVQKLAMDDMRIVGEVRVDPNPGDIAISLDGKRVVTSHFDLKRAQDNVGDIEAQRATLAVIDPSTMVMSGSPDATFITTCIAPHGMVLSPDGTRAYAACYGEDVLAIVDLTDPTAEVKRIPVGSGAVAYPEGPAYGPYAAVLSPDGTTVAVSNTVSNDVRFFDIASETFLADKTIKMPGVPYFVGYMADSSQLYVPTQGPDGITLIDWDNDNAQLAYRQFEPGECEKPHVAQVYDSQSVFVVCEGDQTSPGNVIRLDGSTLDAMGSTPVGVYPDALFRVPGGAP